jgi:hypothetical protein
VPTRVHFTGGRSILVEEDFDQVQQRLEHEDGLFTLSTDAVLGHRVSIHRAAVAYIEEIPMGEQAKASQRNTAAARRRAVST